MLSFLTGYILGCIVTFTAVTIGLKLNKGD